MISNEEIIRICENSNTMSEACAKTGLHFNTFKRKAIKLNVYKTNQSGKGLKKPKKIGNDSYLLQDILDGKHPSYQSNKLRLRLLNEGKKDYICEKCSLTMWQNIPIPLELNHIDGNKNNHLFENLEMLCPNCHAQTSTYRGKNIKKHNN